MSVVKYEPKCYHSHPGLKVGGYTIYGGNASSPIVKDADIYVSLQDGSSSGLATDPWDTPLVQEIKYGLVDGHCPKNPIRFKKMIMWLCNQLHEGKKIHIGCIGGHGRTGLVLSAVAAFLGEEDAIGYVRKNYCDRAVETKSQVEFLVQHFGVKKVEVTKDFELQEIYSVPLSEPRYKGGGFSYPYKASETGLSTKTRMSKQEEQQLLAQYEQLTIVEQPSKEGAMIINPVASTRNLWRVRLR